MNTALPHAVYKSVIVDCSLKTAFRVWTEQINLWWPPGHSLSGEKNSTMLVEPGIGGRILEKTAVGKLYKLGEIVAWNPYTHLAFTWVLGSDETRPSRVNVHFTPLNDKQTQVDLEHRGPEFIGDLWESRIDKFDGAWSMILPRYQKRCVKAE